MTSRTTKRFRKAFRELSRNVQKDAREAYSRFQEDPFYPSLQFKQVHTSLPIYSARINEGYRAVGIMEGSEIVWFWIGSHTDHIHLLGRI